jgi:hypothetical protein
MAISTYSELQTAIANWVERDDLADRVPEFIALAEAEFNRVLIVPEREIAVTSTVTDEELALPDDFYMMRTLYLDTDPKTVLEYMTPVELRLNHSAASTGQPRNYTIQGGDTLVFGPSPDAEYSIIMNYYENIPALSDSNTTNWLLTAHPDIYLFGSLLQAHMYLQHDERVPLWQEKLGIAVGQLEGAARRKAYGNAPRRIKAPYTV